MREKVHLHHFDKLRKKAAPVSKKQSMESFFFSLERAFQHKNIPKKNNSVILLKLTFSKEKMCLCTSLMKI